MMRNTLQPRNLAQAVYSVVLLAVFFWVSLATAQAATVNLAWDYDLTTANLTGFRVYYRLATGSYTSPPVQVGKQLNAPVPGLLDGTNYVFMAKAVDATGIESPPSNERSYTTPSATATPTAIAVTPANPTLSTGSTRQFAATGTYSDNSTRDVTSQVTWASSSTAVATINASGLATAVAAGTTTISAALSGVTGSTTLAVQVAPLAITTNSLPNGTANMAYSATLAASGGTTPYTWSITSGSLPPGLTLNSGAITGMPTTVGTSNFTAQVKDNNNQTATKALSIAIAAIPIASFRLETGESDVDSNWKRVAFTKAFSAPVVVANPLNFDDANPGVIRIRNVNATGFEIRTQAWDYLSEAPITGKVGYLVMEKGSHTLANGIQVEAGQVNTNKTDSFGRFKFTKAFSVAPVVITGVTSVNEASAVVTRVNNVSTTGFSLRMQEQEANLQVHATETIAYIAWMPSSGTVEGLGFQVGKTNKIVTNQFYKLAYPKPIAALPVLLADMQTTNGGDPANLRWQNKTLSSVEVKVAEEQSKDNETNHTQEVVGYILLTPGQ